MANKRKKQNSSDVKPKRFRKDKQENIKITDDETDSTEYHINSSQDSHIAKCGDSPKINKSKIHSEYNASLTHAKLPVNVSLISAMKNRASDVSVLMQNVVDACLKTDSIQNVIVDLLEGTNYGADVLDYMDFLGNGKPSDSQKSILFKLLEQIFIHYSQQYLNEHSVDNMALLIVKKILHSHFNLLKTTLATAVKSLHIKSVFKLLISMVAISPSEVITSSLPIPLILKHLKNRDARDIQDVRTCIVHFIISFLICGDNIIIRQLCEKRDLLVFPFLGLRDDEAQVIDIYLKTLKEKIVQNPAVSKSAKVQIFNLSCLKNVMGLFDWTGPKKYSKKAKYVRREDKEIETTSSSKEEVEQVHLASLQFLTELLSSHKTGIIFKRVNNKYEHKSDNPNHTVTQLLQTLKKPFESPYKQKFVASVLSSCPDQIYYYYHHVKHSFEPRDSSVWFSAMELLIKVASNFKFRDLVTESASYGFDKYLGKKILMQLGIEILTKTQMESAMKNDSLGVKSLTVEYLMLVISNIKEILTILRNDKNVADSVREPTDLIDLLSKTVLNVLPSPWLIFPDVSRAKGVEDKIELKLILDWISKSVQLLAVISELFPNSSDISLISVPALLYILKYQEDMPHLKNMLQITSPIMQLLVHKVERDSKLLENSKEINVVYLLLEKCVSSTNEDVENQLLHLLKYYLGANEAITQSLTEIKVWISVLKTGKSKILPNAVEFLWKAVIMLLTDPSIFIDKCVQFQSISTEREEKSLLLTSDAKRFQILKSNLSENSLLFSPLIPAALELLKETKPKKLPACILFLEKVIIEVLHRSTKPKILCSLVMEYETYLSQSMKEYLTNWLPQSKLFKKRVKNYTLPDNEDLKSDKVILQVAFETLLFKRDSFEVATSFLSFSDLKQNKALSLAMQILLYIQSELESVLDGVDSVGVRQLFKVLSRVIETVADNSKGHPNSSTLEDFINDVFKHDVLLKWFLINLNYDSNHANVEEVNKCVQIVTNFVSKHLSQDSLRVHQDVVSLFKGKLMYFLHVSSSLHKDNIDSVATNRAIIVLGYCCSASELVFILNTISQCEETLNSFSELAISTLLKNYIKMANHSLEGLSFQTLHHLFKLNMGTECAENFDCLLLQLMHSEARFCYALDTESVVRRLNNPSTASIKLILFLCRQNPELQSALHNWVQGNSEILASWPQALVLQLIDVVYVNHIGIANWNILTCVCKLFWKIVSDVIQGKHFKNEELWQNPNIVPILSVMVEKKHLSLNDLSKLASDASFDSQNDTPSIIRFRLIIQLFKCAINVNERPEDIEVEKSLVKLVFTSLDSVMKDGRVNDSTLQLFFKEAKECIKELPDMAVQSFATKSKLWSKIFQYSLEELNTRKHETIVSNINFIFCVCKKLYRIDCSSSVKNPTANRVFDMILTNSSSMSFLKEEIKEGRNNNDVVQVKELLLDIIVFLVMNNSSIYNESHFKTYLECYRATLRTVDQKILSLMRLYESYRIPLSNLSPFYWGKAASDHYTQIVDKPSKIIEPKLDDILNIIRRDFVMNTALHFPLDLELSNFRRNENSTEPPEWNLTCNESPEWKSYAKRMYDPRFLLPLLVNLTKQGMVVNCFRFIQSNCLVLCFSALSSSNEEMRATASCIICRFYQHLESAFMFKDKKLYMALIELLVNAMSRSNKRLPSITVNFLVKACIILGKPQDPLYQITYEYLLVDSKLDFDTVPNFYKLFYNKDINFEYYRSWIINVIKGGFKTNWDFHLCQKGFVFNVLLLFAESSLSSLAAKLLVADFFQTIVSVRAAAFSLYRDKNLLAWITTTIEKEPDISLACSFVNLMERLWDTSVDLSKIKNPKPDQPEGEISTHSNNHPFNASFPTDFIVTHLSILSNIRSKVNSETFLIYLETLQKVLLYMVKSEQNLAVVLKSVHIDHILETLSSLDSNVSTGSNELLEYSKCLRLALEIITFVCPLLNIETFNKVLVRMIKSDEIDLPTKMKWLKNSIEKNEGMVVESFSSMPDNRWQNGICNSLIKYVTLPNASEVSEDLVETRKVQIVELLTDMRFVGMYLNSNQEDTDEKMNRDVLDTEVLHSSLVNTLRMWSTILITF